MESNSNLKQHYIFRRICVLRKGQHALQAQPKIMQICGFKPKFDAQQSEYMR